MALLFGIVIAAVYGISALIVVGGTLAWKMSYRFRALLVGDRASR